MKKIFTLLLVAGSLALGTSCAKESSAPSTPNCGTHQGKQLYLGPQGGCYYLNSSGNKEYVARNLCNC